MQSNNNSTNNFSQPDDDSSNNSEDTGKESLRLSLTSIKKSLEKQENSGMIKKNCDCSIDGYNNQELSDKKISAKESQKTRITPQEQTRTIVCTNCNTVLTIIDPLEGINDDDAATATAATATAATAKTTPYIEKVQNQSIVEMHRRERRNRHASKLKKSNIIINPTEETMPLTHCYAQSEINKDSKTLVNYKDSGNVKATPMPATTATTTTTEKSKGALLLADSVYHSATAPIQKSIDQSERMDDEHFRPGAYREAGPDSIVPGMPRPPAERLDPADYHPSADVDSCEQGEIIQQQQHHHQHHQQEQSTQACESTDGYNDEMTEAHMVSETETILVAQKVRRDFTKRACFVAICSTFIAIILSVALVVVSNKGNLDLALDPRCLVPPSSQPPIIRCYCSNSTDPFKKSKLTDGQTFTYDFLLSILVEEGVLNATTTSSPEFFDSCMDSNQALLQLAMLDDLNEYVRELPAVPRSMAIQLYVLTLIYIQMGGLFWDTQDGWLENTFVCGWFGIVCLSIEAVHGLLLPNNKLEGTIPTEIQYLSSLRNIDLSTNEAITGTIPSQLFSIPPLYTLNLGHTQLGGTIPSEVGNVDRLNGLVFSSALLTGTLPKEITKLQRLQTLVLKENSISGQIPTEIYNMTSLQWMDIRVNDFTGPLPTEIGLMKKLEMIDASINSLSGSLPSEMGLLSSTLEFLNMHQSGIGGMIPEEFCGNMEHSLLILGTCQSGETNFDVSCSCCIRAFQEEELVHDGSNGTVRVLCKDELPANLESFLVKDTGNGI